jgi:hypothetical protein
MKRGNVRNDVDNDNIDEGYYFDLILEYYYNRQEGYLEHSELEIWKDRLIISLMEHLREKQGKQPIKNTLLLLLSLFEDLPVDRFHTCGKEPEQLSLTERRRIKSILREEYV